MSKPPAFQFYADDFLAGTMGMTQAEVGAYIRLLAHQWSKGTLPEDPERLRRLAGGKVTETVLAKFVADGPGSICNPRLKLLQEEKLAFSKKNSEAAKLRWLKGRDDANASEAHMPNGCQTDALHSPLSCTNTPKVNKTLPPAKAACASEGEEPRFEEADPKDWQPPTPHRPTQEPAGELETEPPAGMPRSADEAWRRTPLEFQESLGKDVVVTIWEELRSTEWHNRHGVVVRSWGAHLKAVGPLLKRAILRPMTQGKGLSHKFTTERVKTVGELIAEQAIRERQANR